MTARLLAFLAGILVAIPSLAATPDWYGTPTATSGTVIVAVTPGTQRFAYYNFRTADGTTTSGNALQTQACSSITATLFKGSATAGVKLWAGTAATTPGSSTSSTNLPQITSDAAGAAIDCSTPALCGVRDFKALAIVPTITSACSTGTCSLEVLCK